jgi:hypothetical protein
MKLQLDAEYVWQDDSLVFKALVNSAAGNFNYDLMLLGKFRFANGDLAFDIHYTNATNTGPLSINLNFQGDSEKFLQAVAFHLQISPDHVEVQLTARFSINQRFVAGVGRVMETAQPAAA